MKVKSKVKAGLFLGSIGPIATCEPTQFNINPCPPKPPVITLPPLHG